MNHLDTIDPTEDPAWDALARGSGGSLFVSPPWLRALRDTYGFDFRASIVSDEHGHPLSGIAWAEVTDLRGRRIVALPFSDYADPVLSDEAHWPLLTGPIFNAGLPVRGRTLRSGVIDGEMRLRVVNETAWHGVDLSRPVDEMWSSLHPGARRAVRKAELAGVKTRRSVEAGDVATFHGLHCAVRRNKYRMLSQPVELFEALRRRLGPNNQFHLMLAECDGEVIGGTLYLEWGDTLYYKFNASCSAALALRPNDSLAWAGMRLGHERGLRLLDFGQSDLDQEGLVRYKEKFATERAVIRAFAHDPVGWLDPVGAVGALGLGALTELFVSTEVPDEVYQRAGNLLYRNFC